MREKNRSEIIHDALHMLDDEMIEEVEELRGQIAVEKCETDATETVLEVKDIRTKKRKVSWKKWTAFAASMCVLVVCGWMTVNHILPEDTSEDFEIDKTVEHPVTGNEESANDYIHIEDEANAEASFESLQTLESLLALGYDVAEREITEHPSGELYDEASQAPESFSFVEIPNMHVDLKNEEGIAYDMAGFFIHEGRCYVQNEYIRTDTGFVGDYVGTSTGLIDEWTEEDGYVNGAGTVAGKFYEVKGIDPEFMLCMVWENGVVETFVHNNGITLIKGADVVEKRLHLINNYKEVSFFTDKDWNEQYETKSQPTVLVEENYDVFDKFLESFGTAKFMFIKDSELGKNMVYNSDAIYHLYFTTNEGVVVHFWLLGDGYVVFQGLNNVCVQIDSSVYDEVVEVLEN